jgi:hypothetical protein
VRYNPNIGAISKFFGESKMNLLTKNLLAGAIVGSLALTGAVIADEGVKHKIIEIKAVKGENVNVMVEASGSSQTVIISDDELADSDLLEAKLASLDDETRETVLQALKDLQNVSVSVGLDSAEFMHGGKHRVMVVNKGDGHLVKMAGDNDIEIEIEGDEKHIMRRHIVIGDDIHEALTGHTDVIARLIERGEFSQEELDKIQAAVDAKR